MLLEDVWNFQPPAYTNIVDVQVGNLRRKLDPTGDSTRHCLSQVGRLQIERRALTAFDSASTYVARALTSPPRDASD